MILLIPLIIVAVSLAASCILSKRQNVKYFRFLKYLNIIHLIVVCLFLVFDFLILPLFGGRGETLIAFFIYALFGITTLISNIVVLLVNVCRKS